MSLFLDTDVLLDVLRGGPSADRLLRMRLTEEPPWTSVVNVEELTRGLGPADLPGLASLLEGVRLVPLTAEDAVRAGSWRRAYARRGRPVSQGECLIAAAAAGLGARLATARPSAFPMKELLVERWPTAR